MRWTIAYTTALTAGLLSSSSATNLAAAAFVPLGSTIRRQKAASNSERFIGGIGWDNDNFLDALSKGSDAMKEANERYHAQSRYTGGGDLSDDDADDDLGNEGVVGAQLTKEMIEKVKASHTPEEEASQGGSMFRELLTRAQQQQQRTPPPPPPSVVPPIPQAPPMPGNLAAMTVEEQARMFREMMLMQQQQQQNMMMMTPPPLPIQQDSSASGAVAKDGRRVGRNRDADAIVNTADVYFAQLKRDSTVRNLARYRGDDETANAVFQDPLLKEIKLHTNPYIEEARKKEREMLETSADEIIDPAKLAEASRPVDKSYAGVSYKQKLQEKMKKKNKGEQSVTSPAPRREETAEPQVATPPPPSAATTAAASPPPRPAETIPPPQVVAAAAVPPPERKIPQPPQAAAPAQRALAPEPRAAAQQTTASSAPAQKTSTSPEDTRRDLRTLMGLLLKHRGGPGFGAGRLQGAEKERFESLAAQITSTLEAEVARNPAGLQPKEQQVPPPPASAAVAPQVNVATQATTPPVSVPQAPAQVAQAPAATTTTTAIAQVPAVPDEERINSMLSCIEGAIQMYKNCPIELKEGVLITMRAALLSAVTTCNEIIAKNELRNFENFRTVTTDVRTRDVRQETAARKPMEFYDVIPQREEEQQTQVAAAPQQEIPIVEQQQVSTTEPPFTGNDENSKLLQSLYDEIKAAAGTGKMGLRDDLSADEAAALAENLADIRAILVDELQNGMPTTSSSQQQQPETKSTASKYQEMLAKARAEKANK